MSPASATSLLVCACLFGGGVLGMRLRSLLPEHHLADDSRHMLETGLGIIGTIGGLILGLVVASAFGSYNAQRASLVQLAANVVVLDRALAHYGPEARGPRVTLRAAVKRMLNDVWPADGRAGRFAPHSSAEALYDEILDLKPKNDAQSSTKGQALGLVIGIAQTRWLMYAQLTSRVSAALIIVLVFWFTVTFVGLGIFAKPNPTVIVALFLAAVAVSGALLLLQDMYNPFQGVMQISSAPLQAAYAQLGR